jgi:hypothetical protein
MRVKKKDKTNQSEKQNESEEKIQRFMTAFALILALTFQGSLSLSFSL